MELAYALNTEGLKAGSVYALNRKYALNNGVRLTTRVYGILLVVSFFLQEKTLPPLSFKAGTALNK